MKNSRHLDKILEQVTCIKNMALIFKGPCGPALKVLHRVRRKLLLKLYFKKKKKSWEKSKFINCWNFQVKEHCLWYACPWWLKLMSRFFINMLDIWLSFFESSLFYLFPIPWFVYLVLLLSGSLISLYATDINVPLEK